MFLSAFFTSLGGGVYAMFLQYIDPNSVFSYDLSVRIMVLAVVGGSGTLWGPVVGASLLTPIQQILNSRLGANLAGLALAVYGIVLMLVIYFLPKGIWDAILTWLRKLVQKIRKPKKEQVC